MGGDSDRYFHIKDGGWCKYQAINLCTSIALKIMN